MFVDNLIDAVKMKNNPTVVGLDTRIEFVPDVIKRKYYERYGDTIKAVTESILEFNLQIIDSISDIVGIVKPQLAYYEMYGIDGMKMFKNVVNYAKKNNLLIIADGKRNDISTTAKAYSSAFLGRTTKINGNEEAIWDVDAITLNPYLGTDSVEPFVEDCKKYNKGIFVLVKTSNKSSVDFQDIITNQGKKLYELVAEKVYNWGKDTIGKYGYSAVGGVAGATYPIEAKKLRKIIKNSYLLVPGYGSQGGKAEDMVNFFNKDGLGAIINASRSILCAYKSELWKNEYSEKEYYMASRSEAIKMRDDINKAMEVI